MCGIAGVFDLRQKGSVGERAYQMSQTLAHRGPDGQAVWVDATGAVALAHRRLSIIDLSETGRQPMISACGRFVISYNGELYNSEDLRTRLRQCGARFRGTSDTEVLIEAIARWGVRAALEQVNGIFAFAVWDEHERRLSIARDRLGVKPLYWSLRNGTFLFASELRAMAALPEFDRTLNLAAVGGFLRRSYIGAPETIYGAAHSLLPGTLLEIDARGNERSESYWSLADVVAAGANDRASRPDDRVAIDELEALLSDSIQRQLVSDVPLGAFLSGGIDSSTVVALMQRIAGRRVRTFSIGFHDPRLDEAGSAKAVAAHLGTEHTELYVTPAEAQAVVPELARIYDQPLANASQVPTLLLCRLARRDVTVAISGDGGDELFFGYSRYRKALFAYNSLSRLPAATRHVGRRLMPLLGCTTQDEQEPPRQAAASFGRKAWHAARMLRFASRDVRDVYQHFTTHWPDTARLVPGSCCDDEVWEAAKGRFGTLPELMMYYDALTYMPDDVLAKVDRASMSVGLEARVPILDHRLVEHAWRLPIDMKLRAGVSKWLLRQVLYRHVPRALVDRPKSGFGAPMGQWMRGPLRDWSEQMLSAESLKAHGLFDAQLVRRIWERHVMEVADLSAWLWPIVMLQAWIAETETERPAPARSRPASDPLVTQGTA